MAEILEVLEVRLRGRVAIVGVGDPAHGDDGAGPLVVARLQGRTDALLVDAGDAPVEVIDDIKAWSPDVVLVVDASRSGAPPGSVVVVEAEDFGGDDLSRQAMGAFAAFLYGQTGADVLAVGIQPRNTEKGAEISPEVEETCYRLADLLVEVLADRHEKEQETG